MGEAKRQGCASRRDTCLELLVIFLELLGFILRASELGLKGLHVLHRHLRPRHASSSHTGKQSSGGRCLAAAPCLFVECAVIRIKLVKVRPCELLLVRNARLVVDFSTLGVGQDPARGAMNAGGIPAAGGCGGQRGGPYSSQVPGSVEARCRRSKGKTATAAIVMPTTWPLKRGLLPNIPLGPRISPII